MITISTKSLQRFFTFFLNSSSLCSSDNGLNQLGCSKNDLHNGVRVHYKRYDLLRHCTSVVETRNYVMFHNLWRTCDENAFVVYSPYLMMFWDKTGILIVIFAMFILVSLIYDAQFLSLSSKENITKHSPWMIMHVPHRIIKHHKILLSYDVTMTRIWRGNLI